MKKEIELKIKKFVIEKPYCDELVLLYELLPIAEKNDVLIKDLIKAAIDLKCTAESINENSDWSEINLLHQTAKNISIILKKSKETI